MFRGIARVLVFLCVLSAYAGPAALADDTIVGPTANESTTAEKSLYDRISEKASLTYFGIYRGAAINDLSNSLQPDPKGNLDPTAPQSLESYVTAGYKLNADTVLGAVAHFNYYPVGHPVGTGQDIQMIDPALYFGRANWVNRDGFKLKGMMYVWLPMTSVDTLQKQKLAMDIQPTVNLTYDVPKTPLTLGVYSYVGNYIPTGSTADGARVYKLYIAPNVNYQLSKTVAATLWVDAIQAKHFRGVGGALDMANDPWDIEPGISWDITKNLTVNPIVNIYPGTPTLAATSFQAVLIAKAF